LVIHGGGFWEGSPFPGVADENQTIIDVANDLADAGYYVLVVAYRLAPSGLIPGQIRQDDAHDPNHISGFAPYQEYDVEALVKAARRDPHVRGRKVGVIGGSAGATHAIWAALDTREDDPGVWPEWKPVYRPDAAVALSGAYDFSDRTPEDYLIWPDGGNPVETLRKHIENYTLTNDPVVQHNLSPVHLLELDTFDADHVNPMQIYNTRHDHVPYHQIIDLQCALEAAEVSPQRYTITTLTDEEHGICESHSFGYWDAVKGRVIKFFNQHVMQ